MSIGRREYMKWLIAGGVVCGEGGSMLPGGIELLFFTGTLLPSSFMRSLGIAFTIIGAVSLCIGLPLLYRGIKERNLWYSNQAKSTRYQRQASMERPINQGYPAIPSGNIQRRFCATCGAPLPNVPNIKYCAKCGEEIF